MNKPLLAIILLATTRSYADLATGPTVFVEDKAIPDLRDDGSERFFTFGVLAMPSWFGLRGSLDTFAVGGLTLGIEGTLYGSGDDTHWVNDSLKMSALGYLAYTTPVLFANLRVRAQVGYGVQWLVAADAMKTSLDITHQMMWEGQLLVAERATHDWSVLAGPIVQRTDDGTTTAMMFFGLQRRF